MQPGCFSAEYNAFRYAGICFMKEKLVIISGPTAVGKSDCAVKLAKKINGEVISADSMQVYKGMDIGTAKVTIEEMDGVAHHLIDILEPEQDFNVLLFKKMADEAIKDITSRGAIPIMTGGTGFYIQAVLHGTEFEEEETSELRKELEEMAKTPEGKRTLYEELISVDPASAAIIHENNIKRVIRALEFYKLNAYPISEHNAKMKEKEAVYDADCFFLTDERALLYERIDKRVDIMMEKGLLEEVKRLKARNIPSNATSMHGIGYREILEYLDGKCTLDEAVYKIKLNSRHFAKRQMTWFRNKDEFIKVNRSDFKQPSEDIPDFIYKNLNLC